MFKPAAALCVAAILASPAFAYMTSWTDSKAPLTPEMEQETRAFVVKDFKDPGSAQFRNTFFSDDGTGRTFCGEVNGKNSYGAYVGFRKFILSGGWLEVEGNPSGNYMVAEYWPRFCANPLKQP